MQRSSKNQPAVAAHALPAAPTNAPDQKSVAVLPFVNLSDDKGSEYFSDGVSEELLTVLQKIPGMHVAARTSAFSFKGKNATAQEIGQKLGVAHLVEGSVRKSGDQVRIAARLSRADTGEELWSENYTRDLKDVFAVQTELAQTIVEQLRGRLPERTRVQPRKKKFRPKCRPPKKAERKMSRRISIICKAAFLKIATPRKSTREALAAYQHAVGVGSRLRAGVGRSCADAHLACRLRHRGRTKSFRRAFGQRAGRNRACAGD